MIDEKAAAIVSRVMGRDNHALALQTAREVLALAYEAAKPVAPMSTSGEMVERFTSRAHKIICDAAGSDQCDWSTYDHGLMNIAREADDRLESLEALFAEQAGELESAESHAQMLLLAVEAGDPKPELAMRVKDMISVLSDIRKARGKE